MCVEKIMFSLIRSEISGLRPREDFLSDLTKEKYAELLALSRKHALSHIVAFALSNLNFLGKDEVSNAFYQDFMKAIYSDTQRDYAIALTNKLLEQANIPYINLKGSVIRNMYPQQWMRSSCDIDILIHKSDMELAESLFCNNKYLRLSDSSIHDCNFLSPNKIHIELHHSLTQDGELPLTDKLFHSVWNDYIIRDADYQNRYSITPELFLIYHLAHMGRHLLHGGCGVRPFIDLWLINKWYVFDLSKLKDMLVRCNLLSLYDISMELSKVWLEDHKHNEKTELLEKYVLCGGVYGTTTNAAKVKAAKGIGKSQSFINLVFLPRKNLEVLYPSLKKHPTLYPFYQIKRWLTFLDDSKRSKIKQLIKQRNMVTYDEASKIELLLKQLNLI